MKTIESIIEKFPEELRLPLYEAFTILKEEITSIEIKKVWESINELAEAQKRTEQRVEELAKAQKRTEQRVEELAKAQKRTEQRVEELAKAQKETEQKVEELAEAQKRTERRLARLEGVVEELALAQKKTEEEIRILAKELKSTRQDLGGLSRTISYAFENEAFRMLPKILKEKYGIEVKERLIREEIMGKEINIFGKGILNGKEVLIVGEAKLRITEKKDLEKCFKEIDEKVENILVEYGKVKIIKIIITHFAKKSFIEKAREKGIIIIQSFEW